MSEMEHIAAILARVFAKLAAVNDDVERGDLEVSSPPAAERRRAS